MRIYLSGLTLDALLAYNQKFPAEKPNALISYARSSGQIHGLLTIHREKLGGLILDSGAYTLNNSKTRDLALNLGGYRTYALKTQHLFDFIFNFDDDFSEDGFEHNLSNQIELESVALNPVPVIHDIYGNEIDFYLEKKYPIIALGSIQITGEAELSYACSRLKGSSAKIHLFGNTAYFFLGGYAIWSCDSATWSHAAGRGYILHSRIENGLEKTHHVQFDPPIEVKRKNRFLFTKYPYRDELEKHAPQHVRLNLCGSDGAWRSCVSTGRKHPLLHGTAETAFRRAGKSGRSSKIGSIKNTQDPAVFDNA